MNKIYKVIWSKVKNQYVVVSELAHSSGKQSRTSRSSIRSRIAALVVCGAIAAFGVLPMNSASAAVNVKAGDGIEVDQGWNTTISIKLVKDENEKLESGLTFDTNGGLKVDTGSGLIIKDNKVVIDLASGKGLTFDGNSLALDVKNDSGLTTDDQNGLKVKTGAGLKIDGQGQVALNVNTNNNSGLTFDEKNNELKVNTGSALEVNNNQVNVKLAETNAGLSTEGGLHVDTGDGLTTTNIAGEYTGLSVKTADNSLIVNQDGLKVNIDENSGLDTTTDGLAVKLDGKSLSAGENGLKVNVQNGSGLTADGNGIKINNGDTLKIENNTLDVNLASNSGLATDGGLHVNTGNGLTINGNAVAVNVADTSLIVDNAGLKVQTGAGLTTDSTGLKVNVKDDSGLKFENGALSIDKDALNMGSTNVKGSTNIDVAGDGTVSLKPDVTLDADTKDGNKIDLNGTNGTISAVNSNEKSFLGWESKATNTFDFDENGGNFESVKETTTKEYITGITLSKNIIRNTAEFNEDGATFETNKVDTGKLIDGTLPSAVSHKTEFNENGATFTKNQFDLGEDIDKILSSSSTNIDGGTITLSSGILGDKNKVVIDGTKQEVSGLSNTTWNANDAKDSTKAATEAQLYTVADALEESNGLNVKYDSENKQKVTLGGENSAPVELKNVKAGELGQNSTDAVNGSQLYKTNEQVSSLETTVNNGWTATDGKGGAVNVTPKDNTLQFNGDKNIDVTADKDKGAINVKLNPVVTLDGTKYDGDGIVLNGESGSIHAVNTQAAGIVGPFGEHIGGVATNKFDFNNDGAKFETKVSGTMGDILGNSATLTATKTTKFDENGATFINKKEAKGTIFGIPAGKYTDVSFTNIDGGVVTTDKVQGLDNTKWDDGLANAVDKSKRLQGMAATQGQLRDVDIKVNKNTQAIEENADDIGALKGEVDKVGQGWTVSDENSRTKDFNVKPGETLKFNGDKNIDVTAADGAVNVGLKPVVTLDGDTEDSNKVVLDGENGTISVTNEHTTRRPARTITNEFKFDNEGATFTNTTKNGHGDGWGNPEKSSTNIDGGTITISSDARGKDKVVINGTTGEMSGLSNTDWDPQKASSYETSDKAATEAQLQKATDAISEDLNTLNNFAVKYDKNTDGTVNKNSITLAGGESGTQIHNVKAGEAGTDAVNVSQLIGKTGDLQYNDTLYDNYKSIVKNDDNLTTAVGKLDDAIQKTSETANKGWTAKAGNKDINVKPGDTLQFKGDNNITVTANDRNDSINVELNPVVTLDGNKLDGDSIVLNGYDGTINAVNTKEEGIPVINEKITSNEFDFNNNGGKFVTTEKTYGLLAKEGIVKHTAEFNEDGATFTKTEGIILKNSSTTNIDGGTITTDKVQGLDNTAWDKGIAEKVANNKELQGMAATQGQLQTVDSKVNAGWIATDGTNNVNVNPNNNTLKFAGDDNITVTATTDEKGNNAINVKLDDDITLGNGEDAINIDGNNGTLSIGNKFAVDEAGNVSSAGDVTAAGGKYSLSEVSQYAVRYDDNNGVVNTGKITLAGPNGTTIANVADAKNPDEAVNLHQLEAVKETASAGWTAKAGNDTITVKPNQTLNFEDDGNITVSATSGTSSELKFGLNDNITLGDKAGQKTSTSLTLYTDPSPIKDKDGNYVLNKEGKTVTGYVPESYIDDQGRVDDFVSTHGGFMMYATNTSGQGVFGITTDGMVHAKDVISYMPNSDPNSKDKILKYSLNDIGDIVTQIAHGQYDKTGMEYTLISDFSSVEDKDKPFQAEDGNRTIGLAVRQDGAVVVGAIVDEEGKLTESGIRINDDTNAGGGKDTITGLSNTDWRPAAIRDSISTFGIENDDDSKAKIEKSKAATQGQLDAMYDTVVGYDINESKTGIDYSTITLKGTPYGSTKDGNGSHEGGTLITNVAYAVTDTDSDKYNGSAAVNVDLLKDTVANVTSQPIESDKYLYSGSYNQGTGEITLTSADKNGNNSSSIIIGDIASRSEVNAQIASINSQIKDINTKIENIGTGTGGNNNTDITGGQVDKETGNLVLEKNDGSKVEVGQLTDSAVSDVNFDKEKGTLTITNKDNYTGKESGTPITVEGIASKDDIKTVNDTIGVTSKEDLKEKYKDADTAYITDSETMVDADIALDHAVQDLASNDQYLNSRIDSVEKRLGDVEQRIDKVGAMAAAIANLRTMYGI
jgi:hypothetical protein